MASTRRNASSAVSRSVRSNRRHPVTPPPSLDLEAMREQLLAELASIEERRDRVQRLLEAFDAFEGAE